MPRSTRTFTYTLVPHPEQVDQVEKRARKILGWACDGDERITCHGVTGSALGVVTVSMTIRARDRWWATQLAQDLWNMVAWGVETDVTRTQLESRRQDPHTHRGYAYGRTKRHRDSSSPPVASASDSAEMSSGTSTG